MWGRVLATVTVIAGICSAASAQNVKWPKIEFGRYHALVIGNNDYEHLPKLSTAVGDAEAVATLLEKKYGFQVTKLTNATRLDITGAFNRLRQTLTEKDNLLVYYAGHGVRDEEADAGYWQPVDARSDDDSNWFSNTRLTRYLKAMSAQHVMVVADSCYSGNLTRVATSTVRSGAERSVWMQRMNDKRSRTALTSGGLEPVLDRGGGAHSVFAKAFLTALDESPNVLFGEELFDRVKGVVVANADQTPEYSHIRYTGHEKGDFLFVPLNLSVSVTVQTPPTGQADREALFWQSIQNSEDPADFRDYLEAFPEGTFAALARRRMESAEQKQTALLIPPKPTIEIDPIEAIYLAVKTANVRAEPTVRSAKVTTLKRGTQVHVAGKVKGQNWYLVERGDKPLGYVFGELLMEPEKAKVALAPPPKPQAPRPAQPAVGVYPSVPLPETFRDCADCPEMVVVPAGNFMMGSPASERRSNDEGPQHRVTIPLAFALGKYEVTFAEWDACARGGGCSRRPDDKGWGRGKRPVINVSWNEAKAYARWLSGKTGQQYRLPSEAEWEYAARAGTTTAYHFGDDLSARQANYGGTEGKTVPVGKYPANFFGLHDVHGNVWEWVEDCRHGSYAGAPSDGRAWTAGNCYGRVLRGGSWFSIPSFVRAAIRFRYTSGFRSDYVGFRVARTLP